VLFFFLVDVYFMWVYYGFWLYCFDYLFVLGWDCCVLGLL